MEISTDVLVIGGCTAGLYFAGFEAWVQKADKLWAKAGRMADLAEKDKNKMSNE